MSVKRGGLRVERLFQVFQPERGLVDFLDHPSGAEALKERQEFDLASNAFKGLSLSLVQRFEGVVARLCINVGLEDGFPRRCAGN